MTQADLGRVLGMEDQNTGAPRVSRYETGKHEPDGETLAQIAKALGVPVAYFHAVDDVLAEVILLVSQMPKKEREAVLVMLRERASTRP
jgi:transcriptional regulator with XRE-family HTH domain